MLRHNLGISCMYMVLISKSNFGCMYVTVRTGCDTQINCIIALHSLLCNGVALWLRSPPPNTIRVVADLDFMRCVEDHFVTLMQLC